MATIHCLYSCTECGIEGAGVDVPEREPEKQNVVEWLEGVAIHVIADDHRRRSPHCQAKQLAELQIPIGGKDDPVGTLLRN
jgi:hypothetical protein